MKINLLIIFCCILLLIGCKPQNEFKDREYQTNLVDQYFKAAFNQDYEKFDQLFTKDFLFMGPTLKDTLNQQELINSWRATHQRFDFMEMNNPQIYFSVNAQVEENPEKYAMYYYDANAHSINPDTWINFSVHIRFEFEKKRIDRMYINVNQLDIQQQLGFKMIAP